MTRPVTGLFAFPHFNAYFSVTRRTAICGTQVADVFVLGFGWSEIRVLAGYADKLLSDVDLAAQEVEAANF